MKFIAALYTADGKLVTGRNHGEAFGKLDVSRQDGEMVSGFLDPQTGRFFTVEDDTEFYVKEIIFLRHADVPSDEDDPEITETGRTQADCAASFLCKHIPDIKQFPVFCSPMKRCVQTAEKLNLEVKVSTEVADQQCTESSLDFLQRLRACLQSLPEKSLVVSHHNVIFNMAQLISNVDDITHHPGWDGTISRCSITYINGRKIIWIGRRDFYENNFAKARTNQSKE